MILVSSELAKKADDSCLSQQDNCVVIYDQDEDFGAIASIETSPTVPSRLVDVDRINHLNLKEQE